MRGMSLCALVQRQTISFVGILLALFLGFKSGELKLRKLLT